MKFPIVIHKDPGSSYGVTVPDLPGCFSGAETAEDAIDASYEAISGHIECLLMDRQPIPEKESLEAHFANKDYAGGIWAMIDVDLSKLSAKTVDVSISLPLPILNMIDELAAKEGESRSGFLALAALRHAERQLDAELNLT
jgi:predicted RNase H-like HicB family nuclease